MVNTKQINVGKTLGFLPTKKLNEVLLANNRTGIYVLTSDVTLEGFVTIDEQLSIEGNGHRLHVKSVGKQNGFILNNDAELTISNVLISFEQPGTFISASDNFSGDLHLKNVNTEYAKFDSEVLSEQLQNKSFPDQIDINQSNALVTVENSVLGQVNIQAQSIQLHNTSLGNPYVLASILSGDVYSTQSVISNSILIGEHEHKKLTTAGKLVIQENANAELTDVRVGVYSELSEDALYLQSLRFAKQNKQLNSAVFENLGGNLSVTGLTEDFIAKSHKNGKYVSQFKHRLAWLQQSNENAVTTISNLNTNVRLPLASSITAGQLKLVKVAIPDKFVVGKNANLSLVHSKVILIDETGAVVDSNNLGALAELNAMIGLDTVKEQITRFVNTAAMDAERAAQGIANSTGKSLHMIFGGNAGTGKTVVSRLVAKALFENGVLKSNTFVEASRQSMVGDK